LELYIKQRVILPMQPFGWQKQEAWEQRYEKNAGFLNNIHFLQPSRG
jgi:hypothetical protein